LIENKNPNVTAANAMPVAGSKTNMHYFEEGIDLLQLAGMKSHIHEDE
jgi:hypothetical protein